MLDSAQQMLDASVEDGVSDEEYRVAGGVFTKHQILELEMRHIVGPTFRFRSVRLGRESAERESETKAVGKDLWR